MLNVEIKARCSDPDKIRKLLHEKRADFKGKDHQIDTYFQIPEGRLKLRQGSIENNLIYYQRTNQAGPKTSHIELFPVTEQSEVLKTILAKTIEIRCVVDKQREIYFIDNVKFHIDQVKRLGDFVEIEAIDSDGSLPESRLQEQCDYYMEYLGIQSEDLITHSYSDMIDELS